jgi:hypothetical protein
MRLSPGVRAFFLTRHFEWEVGNGGVWQYVANAVNNDGTNFDLIADGYDLLEVPDRADLVRKVSERMRPFGPLLLDDSEESLPDEVDELELHDDVLSALTDDRRLSYVRAHPEDFAV